MLLSGKEVPSIHWKVTTWTRFICQELVRKSESRLWEEVGSEGSNPRNLLQRWWNGGGGTEETMMSPRFEECYLGGIPWAQTHCWCLLRCLLHLSSCFSVPITENTNAADGGPQSLVITTKASIRARDRMAHPPIRHLTSLPKNTHWQNLWNTQLQENAKCHVQLLDPCCKANTEAWDWGGSVQFSRLILSDPLQPHGLQHARPPCPSPSPGAGTRGGY